MELVKEGEVNARIAEYNAARERERQLMAQQLAELKSAASSGSGQLCQRSLSDDAVAANDSSIVDPSSSSLIRTTHPPALRLSDPSLRVSPFRTVTSSGTSPAESPLRRGLSAPVVGGSTSIPPPGAEGLMAAARTERRVDALERHVNQLKMLLMNCADENRFLRLEVDVLREAVLASPAESAAGGDPNRRAEAIVALELIGRRGGTLEYRDSVCTHCLQKCPCFRCYACRSVEYCSARCQMRDFASHIPLCRHINGI